jgi:hypothetical protein
LPTGTNGQFLKHNGSNWIAGYVSTDIATPSTLGVVMVGDTLSIDDTTGELNVNPIANTNENNSVAINEVGFIKKLAKMRPSNNCCAAITTTNRVIVWGYANGGESSDGGKLAKGFAASNRTPPTQYVRVPFQVDWQINAGGSGIDYLDENPTVSVDDLYWNTYGAIALLSDGTCWVAGSNQGDLGVGAAPINTNFRPSCGFVQVQFGGALIKKIQSASDNNTSNWIFTALDVNDSLWVWGNTNDGCFGTADATFTEKIGTPKQLTTVNLASWTTQTTKSTTETVDFTNNILSWAINSSSDGASAISIVTKDNKLYISGENAYGQRGTGFTTSSDSRSKSGLFNRAKKDNSTFVEDAVLPEIGMYSGRQFHLYINTSGVVFGAGDNAKAYIGNGSTTDSTYFVSSNWPTGIAAEKLYTHSHHYPTVFALCRNTTTNVKTVYSWGYNGSTYGYCGVNSDLDFVNAPTQIQYRATGRVPTVLNNVNDIFVSDQTGTDSGQPYNGGCAAVLDNDGYVYLAGFKTFNDPPEYTSVNAQIFVRVPLKNVKDVILGGNVSSHQWTIFRLKNGTIWGLGDAAQYLFGVGTDTVKHPCRLL